MTSQPLGHPDHPDRRSDADLQHLADLEYEEYLRDLEAVGLPVLHGVTARTGYVIEQRSPGQFGLTADGLTRGTHDLVGLLGWFKWATKQSNLDIYVREGVEKTKIYP